LFGVRLTSMVGTGVVEGLGEREGEGVGDPSSAVEVEVEVEVSVGLMVKVWEGVDEGLAETGP